MNNDELNNQIEIKKTRGGKRPGAGRKRKMEESELITKLSPLEDLAFQKLGERIQANDIKALQIFFNYYLGLPAQKIQQTLEGNLSTVAVEVIRPQVTDEQYN
jgi:hypothetical protein